MIYMCTNQTTTNHHHNMISNTIDLTFNIPYMRITNQISLNHLTHSHVCEYHCFLCTSCVVVSTHSNIHTPNFSYAYKKHRF